MTAQQPANYVSGQLDFLSNLSMLFKYLFVCYSSLTGDSRPRRTQMSWRVAPLENLSLLHGTTLLAEYERRVVRPIR
jgi:hypothetical protein